MAGEELSRLEVERTIQRAEAQLRTYGVRRLALFGSVARGDARPQSDIDLLVQFEPETKTYDNFLRVSELLEELLGCRVELVTTEALSPFIGPHILAEAVDVLRAA
jgi:predicted nucleotidyltransferase